MPKKAFSFKNQCFTKNSLAWQKLLWCLWSVTLQLAKHYLFNQLKTKISLLFLKMRESVSSNSIQNKQNQKILVLSVTTSQIITYWQFKRSYRTISFVLHVRVLLLFHARSISRNSDKYC